MTSRAEAERVAETDFPGPAARWMLWLLLPSDRREELEGDLIEEAETIVMPEKGRKAALRWLWWQVAASAPPMLVRRMEKEASMHPQRWILPAALLLVWGALGLADMDNQATGGFDWGNARVLAVDPGGPAARAGLKEGDRILTLDGIPPGDLDALQRQPRTGVGETRIIEVERADEASGLTTRESIPIMYSRIPARERTFSVVGSVIGLVFLLSGLLVLLKAPGTPSLLFAVTGFGFAGLLLPAPHIGSFGLRALTSSVLFVVFLSALACLLHLLLLFPERKRMMRKRYLPSLIYLPVAVSTLVGIFRAVAGLPEGALRTAGPLSLGLIMIGYLLLSLVALVHSFVTATRQERSEEGLNLMFAGVVVGLLPLTLSMVAGMFTRTDLIPGTDFLFLSLILIPISFGGALLRSARRADRPALAGSG